MLLISREPTITVLLSRAHPPQNIKRPEPYNSGALMHLKMSLLIKVCLDVEDQNMKELQSNWDQENDICSTAGYWKQPKFLNAVKTSGFLG